MIVKIQIKQDKEIVTISVTFRSGWAGDYNYHFTNNCEQPSYAGLVAEQINDQFHNQIKLIRESAYNKGYTDGKGHKTKSTWFGDCFNHTRMS